MKKRYFIILLFIAVIIIGFLVKSHRVIRPFQDLCVSEISNVSVELLPPDVLFELSDTDIEELAKILRTVVIYHRDDSYSQYNGRAVIYTVTKTDGEQIVIQASNPFLIIDGEGYKTKYEPCEELNRLGNRIMNARKASAE